MVEEHGIVTGVKGANAVIRAERTSSCDGCATKKTCATGANGEMCIEADNAVGAKTGDHVIFTIGSASVMKAGVLLYLVPVLSFIAGVVIGQIVSPYLPGVNHDLVSGALGAVFLAAAFVGLKLYGRFLDKDQTMRPRILRVV